MKEKYILEGVITDFEPKLQIEKKLGKKIKGRKAIPNYARLDRATRKFIMRNAEDITKDKEIDFEILYNLFYMRELKDALYTCKQFECGNISDSSEILILSLNEGFYDKEYTMKGIFNKNKITI